MSKLRPLVLFAFLAAGGLCAGSLAAAPPDETADPFSAILAAHLGAIEARDWDAFDATLTSNEVLPLILPNGKMTLSATDYRKEVKEWLADPTWRWSYRVAHRAADAHSGLAILDVDYRDLTDPAAPASRHFLLTLVFREQPGGWRLVHDQNTLVREPVPEPVAGLEVTGECRLSREDEGWIVDAARAWGEIGEALGAGRDAAAPAAVFFDATCRYTTEALTFDGTPIAFRSSLHPGAIELPNGATIPAGVTSFAAPIRDGEGVFFTMAAPSIWRAAGVGSQLPLADFLTSVMLHEISHTTHFATYLGRVASLESLAELGGELDDDVVQKRFRDNDAFAAAVERENAQLLAAAEAPTVAEARRLAADARQGMLGRRAKYYRGKLTLLGELEELFLTLEGAGEWAAFTWLASPDGGGLGRERAIAEFNQRANYWSQRQGLALLLALDRLDPNWETTVFGDGARTAPELLDAALAAGGSGAAP